MNKGLKGHPYLTKNGNFVGRRFKGFPAVNFKSGLKGYPYVGTYHNDPGKLDITGRTQFRFVGDSYMIGLNASSGLTFAERMASVYGITDTVNYAEAGKGWWNQAFAIQTASWTAGQVVLWVRCGFNDSRRGGSRPQNLKKAEAGINGIILKSLLTGVVASGSSGVTRNTGSGETFAGFAANTVGGRFPTGTLPGNFASFCSSGAGGTWTWSFTGTSFAVQMFGSDGVTFTLGNATIHVDGVLVYTFTSTDWYDGVSDGSYDNARGPVPLMFFGFADAAHTVVVTSTTAAPTAIDFFTQLIPPTSVNAPIIVYFTQPTVPRQGYEFSTAANGSPRDSWNMDQVVIEQLRKLQQLGYKFTWVDTDKFESVNNVDDYVHRTTYGHGQWVRAGISAIKRPVVLFPP